MSRTLALVAAAGFVLCIVFFGLAFLIAGDMGFERDKPFAAVKPLIDMATRKEWGWNGGDTITVSAPMVMHYQPEGPAHVTVTGPAELLTHVRVGEGQINSDTNHHNGPKLDAVVSGVRLRKFVVMGNQQLELGHIDQDALDVRIAGSGSVRGEGRVGQFNLVIAGNGNADLGGLSVQDAKVAIFGHGDATLAPHQSLFLTIAGDGTVRLKVHPASLRKTIIGYGRIIDEDGSAPPVPPEPPAPSVAMIRPPPPLPPGAETSPGKGRNFVVGGSANQDLGQLDGGDLNLTVTGSGSVKAAGKVDRLTLMVSGSGSARLGELAAREVTVTLAGSGSATIAPEDEAHVTILASGNVYLRTRPRKIENERMGSGRVIQQ